MREIMLTRGAVALVDEEDYARVACYRWHIASGYAQRSIKINGKHSTQLMHRALLDAQPGQRIDHIDGDGLNNQRANLRFCTHAENIRNARKHRGDVSSRFKGVSWHSEFRRWAVWIGKDYKHTYLGCFTDETEAARAYDEAARQLHGEFARLNFPQVA